MTRPHVVVVGGNGFVGSAVCRALLRYADVTSISRSGPPPVSSSQRVPEAWTQSVNWHVADVFDANSWQNVAKGASATISVVGGFGSQAQMERICGDANVVACRTSAALSIPRFVFISAHKFNLGPLQGMLAGYYRGKEKAEAEVHKLYSSAGTIIRPSFVHGTRLLPNGMSIPLSLIGSPLALVTSASVFRKFEQVPLLGAALVPPVSVDSVADAAAAAALGAKINDFGGAGSSVVGPHDIAYLGSQLHSVAALLDRAR